MSKSITSKTQNNKDLHLLLQGSNALSFLTNSERLLETYNKITNLTELLPNILDEIFIYVAQQYANKSISIPVFDSNTIQLKEKIKINFLKGEDNEVYHEVVNQYRNYWEYKSIVDNYIAANFSKYETPLYALLDTIRKSFMYHPSNRTNKVQAPVTVPYVLYDITLSILPLEKQSNMHYKAAALSVVLYFFEYCDFGFKHIDDPQTLFTNNDRKDDST